MKAFTIFFLVFSSSFSLSIQANDLQHLLSFKAALRNPSVLQNWSSNQSPCGFKGVSCKTSASVSVSSIDLSFIPLSVDFHSVASYLLTLDTLETLSLKDTNLSGSISLPAKCSSFLISLDLSLNTLSGPLSDISYLGSCSSLKKLNLSSNLFDFSGREAGGLKLSLEALDLSFNKISGANVVPWILFYGCDELKHLSLKENKVSGDINLSKCKNLQFLDLASNNFSMPVPSFRDCLALEYLDISANMFTGDVGHAISACEHLSFLNVSSNFFSGPIPVVSSASDLQYLILGENHFLGEIPLHLVDLCKSLVKLDLSSNNLSGKVPSSFSSCSLLESFDISSNIFTGELPIEILLSMRNLKELVLSFNDFTGALPDSLSNLTNLETLDLSSNNLSGSIPVNLCQSSLKELYLQNNMLIGTIPATLSNCSRLVSLHLSVNYFTGSIPSSLGSLSRLRDLKLWLNELQGQIPSEIGNIGTLETLVLDFNELTGTLPSALSNCTNLNWISLSNNQLSGEIPSWIGLLSNLAILKLSNNSFYGRIPPELGNCQSLIWLDLNTNFFNGSIPPALFIQSGKIAANFIMGKKIVYIKNDRSRECHGAGNLLEFAGIRVDQLTRISTRSLCNFSRVYGGLMLPRFYHNRSMMFLDISYNMLSGSIPKEIGSMTYLFVLNLGHNNLSSNIPTEVGDLKALEVLDLSSNRLEGTIPTSMRSLTFLSDIDLSSNQLTGMIPLGGQFDTFPRSQFMNNSGLCGSFLPPCREDSVVNNSGLSGLPLPPSREDSVANGNSNLLIFKYVLPSIILFVLIAIVVSLLIRCRKRTEKSDHKDSLSLKTWRRISYFEIQQATDGFNECNLLGIGSFGSVYKGTLSDGTNVAIKVFNLQLERAFKSFDCECEVIRNVRHRNLLKVISSCSCNVDFKALVLQYMPNGSLEKWLYSHNYFLDIIERLNIMIDVGVALEYLHHGHSTPMVHCDLKPSNILLDENMVGHVSDFGISKILGEEDDYVTQTMTMATIGYIAPEYGLQGMVSPKCDVYSYGVLLMETFTRKKPTDEMFIGERSLIHWVKESLPHGLTEVVDANLLQTMQAFYAKMNCLSSIMQLALDCCKESPHERIYMTDAAAEIKKIKIKFLDDIAVT